MKLFYLFAWLGASVLLFSSCQTNTGGGNNNSPAAVPNLIYTKHARCRMECRHITDGEIKEILAENHINMRKSNPNDPRGATYAYEGNTSQNQHLRIVVDKAQSAWKIVTCIDLDHDYECDCN